jgi:acylphosphatase
LREKKLYRTQILYAGWAQGVGLRFAVPEIAKQCHLCGWVTNLPDGKVEIVVEGTKKNVEAFIDFLDEKYDFLISPKEKEIKKLKTKGDLTEFQIEL